MAEIVKTCPDPTDADVQLVPSLTPTIHQSVSTSRPARRTKTVLVMPSAAKKRFVCVQNPTRDPTVRVHVPTSSVLPTPCVLCSMESPGVCVTRATSLLDLVYRDVLMSMNVLANLVAMEPSVTTRRVDTDVSVPVGSQVIPMLPVLGNRTRSSAVQPDLVLVENFVVKENVFVNEDSNVSHLDCAEILMNVPGHLLRIQSVVKMLSVRIFPAVSTASVPLDTMAILSSRVSPAMEQTVAVLHHTTLTPLATVSWRAARPRETVQMEPSVSPSLEECPTVPVQLASTLSQMELVQILTSAVQPPDLVGLELCVRTRLDPSAVFVPWAPPAIPTMVCVPPIRFSAAEMMTVDPMRSV